MASDLAIVAGCVVAAFHLRFSPTLEAWFPSDVKAPRFSRDALPVLAVVPIMFVSLYWSGLYRPRRDQRFFKEAADIVRAVALGSLLFIAFLYLFHKSLLDLYIHGRLQSAIFAVLMLLCLIAWRYSFRTMLHSLRKRGFNLRHVAIIGTGRLGQVVCHTLRRNSWTGITPVYFVGHQETPAQKECLDLPVHGGLNDLDRVFEEHDISGVFIALPGNLAARLPDLLMRLERYPLDVRIVPDVNPRHLPINMAVHEVDGMPVLSVRESPLSGWGRILKRGLDLAGSVVGLALFVVPMLVIALLIRLSSRGPVIFRQERMSLNGQRFRIYKFRTMRLRDEDDSLAEADDPKAAWTKRNDARVTRIGRLLRKTSLDELPQLLNVLLGEMSLVGPRPERPELIHFFRENWRGYMLRQNVKAGMTGWAQVNGLRGDTSLRKRLQYDLFYIRNWSIFFDLRILWMTLFRGFAHPNAH